MATVKIGAIRARKDRPGMYEAHYYVNGKRRRVLADSRENVSLKVANLIKEAEKEPEQPVSAWHPDTNLSAYSEYWLDDAIAEILEPSTVAAYRQMLNAHIIPFKIDKHLLGNMRLRDIRRRHVKALIINKRKEGYSKDTVRHIRAALSSLLTDATEDEIIELNPALQVSDRKRKIADKKNRAEFEESITPMSFNQFLAFIEKAKDPIESEFGPFFIFLGKTGLRPSEAIALLPSDIDEKKRKVQVSKAYPINSGRVRPFTKTGKTRMVDLSPGVLQVLEDHRNHQNEKMARKREEAFKKGDPVPEKPIMLFPNRAGKYIDWNNAADAFHRICKKAKIGKFRPYSLRHTFATLLLAKGVPITYVASQLGHSNPETTLRYYAKWLPDQDDRFIELLDGSEESFNSDVIEEVV